MTNRFSIATAIGLAIICFAITSLGQPERPSQTQKVRTVSIPISIFTKQELEEGLASEILQAERLTVREDNQEQTILSIRSITDAPLSLAILIQDDLESSFNLQLKDIQDFIKRLPRGSRVMVGYLRGGSLQVRQRFTDDLEAAAKSIRIVASTSSAAPRSPYDSLIDALNRFDALPAGRRAVLMFSDGLDASQGLGFQSSLQSLDLDRAILRAQRRSVAVYSIYSPATFTATENSRLILSGQSALQRLAEQTGGRSFYQGSIAPISLDPFFKDLRLLLNRQFLLSYLSTHMKKKYYKVEITSTNPLVKIEHPKGYYYR